MSVIFLRSYLSYIVSDCALLCGLHADQKGDKSINSVVRINFSFKQQPALDEIGRPDERKIFKSNLIEIKVKAWGDERNYCCIRSFANQINLEQWNSLVDDRKEYAFKIKFLNANLPRSTISSSDFEAPPNMTFANLGNPLCCISRRTQASFEMSHVTVALFGL